MARVSARLALTALVPLLHGCAGAPSFAIFGAYFPLWLVGALLGVLGAVISYRLFVATGWAAIIRFPLLVHTAIGLMVAEIVWLLGTGHIL